MKILILGCGYVGSEVARFWQDSEHQVTVTTTTPERVPSLEAISDRVEVVSGSDLTALKQVTQNQDIILLAVGAKGKDTYRESYLETSTNLITALENNQTVKQIIYTGSYGVLGDREGQLTDETVPTNPITPGGKVLAETEQVLLAASSDRLKVCVLRLGGIYGKGRELIKIFGSRSGTVRPGAGEDYSNWIHLTDIVNAIELARTKQLSGIFNLACDECLTTKEFFRRLYDAHNLPGITWDASQKSTRSYNTRLSNQKIKTAGMKFSYPQLIFLM